MSKKAFYTDCPRCGSHSFEHLQDYSHCPNCLYVNDRFEDHETCYYKVRPIENELAKSFKSKNQDIEEPALK
jgi:hypothetical protein